MIIGQNAPCRLFPLTRTRSPKLEMTERLSIANIDARLPVTNEERGVAVPPCSNHALDLDGQLLGGLLARDKPMMPIMLVKVVAVADESGWTAAGSGLPRVPRLAQGATNKLTRSVISAHAPCAALVCVHSKFAH